MKLFKISSLLPLALGPILPISANEYEFKNIKFDQINQIEKQQNIYKPKDKIDEYIIDASIYATKFVPLINNGSDESEFTKIMANDGKRLLVDTGYGCRLLVVG